MKLTNRLILLLCLVIVSIQPGFAYKVEKPEAPPPAAPRNDIFDFKHAPREATLISVGEQGKATTANTGSPIYLAQTYVMYPGYRLKEAFKGFMPGSMRIPFRFWLNPGDLFFRDEDTKFLYFAPKAGDSGASFPGLGEVVSGNDTVGLRRSKKDGHIEWYVNNSNFNNTSRRIIWSRKISEKEHSIVDYVPEGLPYKTVEQKKIVYDGFFNNVLIFTLIDVTKDGRKENEFRFTPSPEGETIVVIGGVVIKCKDVISTGMNYTILSINEH